MPQSESNQSPNTGNFAVLTADRDGSASKTDHFHCSFSPNSLFARTGNRKLGSGISMSLIRLRTGIFIADLSYAAYREITPKRAISSWLSRTSGLRVCDRSGLEVA